MNIGTDASAKAITLGNVVGATSLSENVGTGNFTLNGVGASTYTIGAATTTGTITIGGTAQTGTIGIGTGTGAQTINVGTGAGIKTMNIGTGAVANVITIGSISGAAFPDGICRYRWLCAEWSRILFVYDRSCHNDGNHNHRRYGSDRVH